MKEHLGSIEDFLAERKIENLQELERRFKAPDTKQVAQVVETESQKAYNARKVVSREERKIRNRINFLENEIDRIEKEMKKIEGILASPGPDDDIMELTRSYLEHKRDLDAKTEEWAELSEQVDQ